MNLNSSNNENSNSEKIQLFSDSDVYWEKYWSKIDKAKDFIFIITYDIDNKMIANITLRKIMDAMDRGVRVVLLMEHLNFYMKHSIYKQLKKKGAIIIKPNPMSKAFSYILNSNKKKFFNRCHQKVSLIDKDLFLGSINIAEEYSDVKYGTNKFLDLNMYIKNTICFHKVLNFFRELIMENKEQIKREDKLKDLEEFFKAQLKNYKTDKSEIEVFEEFLEEKPPEKSEIQDNLYDLLDSSKKSITIVQAYYSNLKRIEDILIQAIKRGVQVKIITSEKRDQTCYKYQYNSDLFENLIKNGVEVYEFMDKYLHMKAYYIDGKIISMGSLNNDKTSFLINNEANYLIKKNEKNKELFSDFDAMLANISTNTRRVELNTYKNPIRFSYSYWWYFFLWCMEHMVPNRKAKYTD